MQVRRTWRALVAVCALGFVPAAPAAELPLAVSIKPPQFDLCATGGTGRAWVVLRNSGTQPVRNVCLRALANGAITWKVDGKTAAAPGSCEFELPQLAANTTHVQGLTVTLEKPAPANPALYLRADFASDAAGKVATSTDVATLEVRQIAAPGADALKAEAKVDAESLHENASTRLVLTLTNGTAHAMKLGPPKFAYSKADDASTNELTLSAKQKTSVPAELPANTTTAIEMVLTADADLRPGKRNGVIEIEAVDSCGRALRRVAHFDIKLGVFGQSDLLTALGVPTLLLLPGFLMVGLWSLLWRFKLLKVSFLGKSGADAFVFELKSVEFWLVAITLSLIAFWAGPKVVQLGYRDEPYNLGAIAALWALSLGAGLALYLAMLFVDRHRLAKQAKDLAARTLTEYDDVVAALEKARLLRWSLDKWKPVQWQPEGGKPSLRGFRLWPAQAGSTWVVPALEWRKQDAAGTADPEGAKTIEALLEEVRKIEKATPGAVRWLPSDGFSSPRQVPTASLADDTGVLVSVVTA